MERWAASWSSSPRERTASSQSLPGQSAQARYRQTVARLQQAAQASQPAVISDLQALARNPALEIRYQSYWIANALAVWGKRPAVEAMAARPEVVQIASNRPFRVALEPAQTAPTAAAGVGWGVAQVHAPDLWAHGNHRAGDHLRKRGHGGGLDPPGPQAALPRLGRDERQPQLQLVGCDPPADRSGAQSHLSPQQE